MYATDVNLPIVALGAVEVFSLRIGRGCSQLAVRRLLEAMKMPALEALSVDDDRTWSALQCYMLAKDRAERGMRLKKLSVRLPQYPSVEGGEDTDLMFLRQVIDEVALTVEDLPPSDFKEPEYWHADIMTDRRYLRVRALGGELD